MRVKSKKFNLKSREGETRTVRKFLLWPRQFGDSDWRFFEFANIVEKVMPVDIGGHDEYGNYKWMWREIDFAD